MWISSTPPSSVSCTNFSTRTWPISFAVSNTGWSVPPVHACSDARLRNEK
jgi:hypothetical protein